MSRDSRPYLRCIVHSEFSDGKKRPKETNAILLHSGEFARVLKDDSDTVDVYGWHCIFFPKQTPDELSVGDKK